MALRDVERVVIAIVDEDNDGILEDEARRCFVVIESMILSQNHWIEGNLKDILQKKIKNWPKLTNTQKSEPVFTKICIKFNWLKNAMQYKIE